MQNQPDYHAQIEPFQMADLDMMKRDGSVLLPMRTAWLRRRKRRQQKQTRIDFDREKELLITVHPPIRGRKYNRGLSSRKWRLRSGVRTVRHEQYDDHASEMAARAARRKERSERSLAVPVPVPKKKVRTTTDVEPVKAAHLKRVRRNQQRMANTAATARGKIEAQRRLANGEVKW